MENNLLQTSVTLAQVFVDSLEGYSHDDKLLIGDSIIKFLYKWLGSNDDNVEYALLEYSQHNTDCRYECYCCGQCHDIEDFKMDEPNIKDEYVKNIKDLLLTFTEYKGENEDINKIFSN